MVRPKKHLGQHFLTDPGIAARIVDLMPDNPEQTVLEIGPGTGVLTRHLVDKNIQKLYLVEIDSESIDYLKQHYPDLAPNILEEDFLKLDLSFLEEDKIRIIGNFPYNISSQIFFRVLNEKDRINSVTCMIQKEVANRILAGPGSKTYGILSVLLQAYYDISPGFMVKPGSFFPPPKVNSSVIILKRNAITKLDCDEKLFFRVVKATFNQRRKTIRNSLKTILLNLDDDFPLLAKRPEQLGVAEFIELTNWTEARLPANK